ncbi:MAG: hypothetical protein WCX30_00810 [Candidatus Paceibacterota bacterium]|jgi:hypothetical protein|nr:hypothetical protein [bacterium]
MSLCPVCGWALCDHTAEERGQTYEEMDAELTQEERDALNTCNDGIKKIAARNRAEQFRRERK